MEFKQYSKAEFFIIKLQICNKLYVQKEKCSKRIFRDLNINFNLTTKAFY